MLRCCDREITVVELQRVGFHKPAGRRGQSQGGKDLDGLPISTDGKTSKRGGGAGYCPLEVHAILPFRFSWLSFHLYLLLEESDFKLNITYTEASVGSKIQLRIIVAS